MAKEVITVTEDTPIEEAARIMADKKIGALPVMKGEKLVGIITETNLFRIFLELLGARSDGVRLSVMIKDEPGGIANIAGAIRDAGGNIVALVTTAGDAPGYGQVTMKVQGVPLEKLSKAVWPFVEKVIDIR
jgi:acetoin utilization protein AcuB